jgi:transposase
LRDDELDFVDLANTATDFDGQLLDTDIDPDQYRLAEIAVEYYCKHYGIQRHGKGDRLSSIISTYRRYLVPFLVELDASRPAGRQGVADLRVTHLEVLPQILAGDRPLPAATIAGDVLGRRGISCLFLSIADAASVTVGGHPALELALADGTLSTHADARTAQRIIRTVDLRNAGLLVESTTPHGLAASTAGNTLRDLQQVIERARGLGAGIRGAFKLEAIEPLAHHRRRAQKGPTEYVSFDAVALTAAHMRAIGQVVLWIGRLVGARISEIYGVRVSDYYRDAHNRPWLTITKQGGLSSLGRDEDGHFQPQDSKNHTKTDAGKRTIMIPQALGSLLDSLIVVFHTDAMTGQVDDDARLIPGLHKDDASGQSSFRTWLKQARTRVEFRFDPHDLRDALITDLRNGGIDERTIYYYVGHERPNATVQDKAYDLGPSADLLQRVAALLDLRIAEQLGITDLRVPTALVESWGEGTRRHRQSDWIEDQLRTSGWRLVTATARHGRELDVAEVATRIDRSPSFTRTLMRRGTITAHPAQWGARQVWVAYEADVARYLDATTGVTVNHLAAELGWGYHQLWHVLRELGLSNPKQRRGAAIRLSVDEADAVRTEARRRAQVNAAAATVQEAAQMLGMDVGIVGTLIRQGRLEVADGHDQTRNRHVTRASVLAFLREHPLTPAEEVQHDGSPDLLTLTETKRLLGVTRNELSTLIQTRQVRTHRKEGSRHIYVTADSAMEWAGRVGRVAAAAAVAAAMTDDARW